MKRLITIFCMTSLMLATLLLAGCGFHLQRPLTFTPQVKQLYIQTSQPYSSFIQSLKRTLTANELHITHTAKSASATLNIIKIHESNGLSALSGGGSAGQYTTRLSITFSVVNAKGKVLLPANTLSQSSSYSSNATQVLSSVHQSQSLLAQMESSLSQQIVSQLAAIQPAKPKKTP